MVIQCCVCRKIRQGTSWVAAQQTPQNRNEVSHSYCPECAKRAIEEIRSQSKPLVPKSDLSAASVGLA